MARLSCSRRTVERYRQRFYLRGPEGLDDRRKSNYRKIGKETEARIVSLKQEGQHRSARFIKDHLGLRVHRETVRRILVRYHLSRLSLPPVKRVERFEAAKPNALWQIDIMGKTHFSLIGGLYLICLLDDHSRFIPYGQWFYRQYGINVYQVLYNAFIRFGLPAAILSDRASQFRSTQRGGEANSQWYAQKLGITPVYGQKPQTKGKIEGLFRYIQRDFVMESRHLDSLREVNGAFGRWVEGYNFGHEHEGIR
jgi:transposase